MIRELFKQAPLEYKSLGLQGATCAALVAVSTAARVLIRSETSESIAVVVSVQWRRKSRIYNGRFSPLLLLRPLSTGLDYRLLFSAKSVEDNDIVLAARRRKRRRRRRNLCPLDMPSIFTVVRWEWEVFSKAASSENTSAPSAPFIGIGFTSVGRRGAGDRKPSAGRRWRERGEKEERVGREKSSFLLIPRREWHSLGGCGKSAKYFRERERGDG